MVEHEKTYKDIPTVALRGLVVLPGEMLHFDAGRPKSVHALNRAMDEEGLIFVSAQKDPKISEIEPDDIYETGTLCALRQVLPMPGDSARVFVEGVCRALAVKVRDDGEGFSADIEMLEDEECKPAKAEALRRRVDKKLGEYAQLSPKLNSDIMANIEAKLMPGEFADAAANAVLKRPEQRQEILEELDPAERMKKLLSFFVGEIDILKADRRIAAEVKYQVDKSQKEYYYREQIKAIRKELGESSDTEADEFRAKLEHKQMPDSVRSVIEREIERYGDLPAGSHEAPSARNYIECMLDLPWNEESTDNMDLAHARETLDSAHYGMDKVKERIIEYMAVARLTGKVNGQVICFVGPPGVGKTSIAKSIADALGRRFVRMSLGGIRDEAEIRGHRRTYIGAMPGRVISAMRQAGVMNPVILFDEIDKLAGDYHGDPAAAMLEVLDSAQNFAFRDHFIEVPYDLSKVMFLTTANDRSAIPAPLLDRMEVIEVPGYLETEKIEIAKRHLLPKQMEKNGLKKSMLTIPDPLYPDIIRGYTAESGVRSLERVMGSICRKAACDIGDGKAKKVRLTKARINEYLGRPRYNSYARAHKDEIGLVNGLAWTSAGGDTLEIEVQTVPGSGKLMLTGQLGDVMQESAKAALTFVHANAERLGIDEATIREKDIHLHVPEGAVPKDGPSAGITMAVAIASALSGIPVKGSVAMTGEITLRGRVLPIGGLREKLLAAVRAGMTAVIMPEENRKDLEDVPEEIKKALELHFASNAITVMEKALAYMPKHSGRIRVEQRESGVSAVQ